MDSERDASKWVCPVCREIVEANFEICWNCQHPRPGIDDVPETQAAGDVMIGCDFPCRSCEYNLRGLTPQGRCPECGAPILYSLLDRLKDGCVEDPELHELLNHIMAPVATKTGTPIAALWLICQAWVIASEPGSANGAMPRTPAAAVQRSAELFGELAVDCYGSRNAAIVAIRAAGLHRPAALAGNIRALVDAGLLEHPGFDIDPLFAQFSSMMAFIPAPG